MLKLDLYSYEMEHDGMWHPATRQQATMETSGPRVYLIGGTNCKVTNEVLSINYVHQRW